MLALQGVEILLYGYVKSDIQLNDLIFGGNDVEDKTYDEELCDREDIVQRFSTSKQGGDPDSFGILIPEEVRYISEVVQGTDEKDT